MNPFANTLAIAGRALSARQDVLIVYKDLPPGMGAGYVFAKPPEIMKPSILLPRLDVTKFGEAEKTKWFALIVHEMLHHDRSELESVAKAAKDSKFVKDLHNCLEDARIEIDKMQKWISIGALEDLYSYRMSKLHEMERDANKNMNNPWGWLFQVFKYYLPGYGMIPIPAEMKDYFDIGMAIVEKRQRFEKSCAMGRPGTKITLELAIEMAIEWQQRRDEDFEDKNEEEKGEENDENDITSDDGNNSSDRDDSDGGSDDSSGQPDKESEEDDQGSGESDGSEQDPNTDDDSDENNNDDMDSDLSSGSSGGDQEGEDDSDDNASGDPSGGVESDSDSGRNKKGESDEPAEGSKNNDSDASGDPDAVNETPEKGDENDGNPSGKDGDEDNSDEDKGEDQEGGGGDQGGEKGEQEDESKSEIDGKDDRPQNIKDEYGNDQDGDDTMDPDSLGQEVAALGAPEGEGSWDPNEEIKPIDDKDRATPEWAGDPYIAFTKEDREIVPLEDAIAYGKITDEIGLKVQSLQMTLTRILRIQTQTIVDQGYRTGRLDSHLFHKLIKGNRKVKSRTTPGKNLDTAVTLLLDLSGSMSGDKAALAVKIGSLLGEAMNPIQKVEFEILGYNSSPLSIKGYNEAGECGYTRKEVINYWLFKQFNENWHMSRNRLGACMSSFNDKHPELGGATGGCNIDHENFLHAAYRLCERREKNKVMIVICDGAPSGYNGEYGGLLDDKLIESVQRAKKAGIKVFCFGIKSPLVERYYAPDFHLVNSLEDLDELALIKLGGYLLGQ